MVRRGILCVQDVGGRVMGAAACFRLAGVICMHVLIVEDDVRLAALLRKGLKGEGYIVDHAADGPQGLDQAESNAYDAVILDLSLPGLDGLEIARQLRQAGSVVPIVMLTARSALHQRLEGFSAGADDYLAKPFAFAELLARLRAVTRRGASLEQDQLTVGDLVLDRVSHEVRRGGRSLTLAPREYALLEYLMRNPGHARSRTMILERVWDYGYEAFTNVVDAAILRLRKEVDQGFETPLIHTVRGVGYMIKA
jgi:two-component system OmpR family response regulator